ncbi:MAG TPA: enolase C-terminal domain-like protein, partial [Steroidobacteraceae bacterium]|nr:enolase C-terminal domain-like protein [Steroidobacteraceae bacterium]
MSARPLKSLPGASGHRIASVGISHHRLPLAPAFNASWDTKPRVHFDATIVRVTTDSGLMGVGSGDRMLGFEGHEELFVGEDPLALERHYRVLSNIDFHYGRCWPLDLALWDLAGKVLRQPCWKLLGGLSQRVRAYASSGTLRDPQAQADAAERYLAHGFPAMKLRFHRGDWRDDLKALEAVRARVGNKLELLVDCNQGWRMSWDTESA